MPPRYAYWTILVDDQPTAFRSGSQEELMPTFNRLQQKHPSAKMMWWQNGKLWASRVDAQEAMLARGEIGRRSDPRQEDRGRRPFKPADRYSDRAPSSRERREERNPSGKLDWKPKQDATGSAAEGRGLRRSAQREGGRTKKPEWIPKSDVRPSEGEARGARRSAQREGGPKPVDPRSRSGSLKDRSRPSARSSRPKAANRAEARSAKADPNGNLNHSVRDPKLTGSQGRTGNPRVSRLAREVEKLDWKPKGESVTRSRTPDPGSREKRKWVPKAEYKKSLGIEAKKDKNWRPGGEHKDPRQKYKDAKKAKWGRFKQTVRKRWEAKGKKDDK